MKAMQSKTLQELQDLLKQMSPEQRKRALQRFRQARQRKLQEKAKKS